MSVGDLVLFGYGKGQGNLDTSEYQWGLGIILFRKWNDKEMIWENIVWFDQINEHVLCDDCDLKKVA